MMRRSDQQSPGTNPCGEVLISPDVVEVAGMVSEPGLLAWADRVIAATTSSKETEMRSLGRELANMLEDEYMTRLIQHALAGEPRG